MKEINEMNEQELDFAIGIALNALTDDQLNQLADYLSKLLAEQEEAASAQRTDASPTP